MEVADQRVAAPARPDLGKGDGRQHPDGNVPAVAILPGRLAPVEGEAGGMDGERASGGGALLVQRIPRRPAPRRAFGSAVMASGNVGRGQLGGQRQQPVRLQPPGRRAGGGEGSLQRPAEGAERGLRRRAGTARETGGDEHPVVREGEGRSPVMQSAPAAGGKQVPASCAHAGERAVPVDAIANPRLGPGAHGGAEAGARPVDDLDGAALGRGVCQRAGKRPQGLGVDTGEGRQLEDEARAGGVDVELARLVEGAPGQQRMQRGRHGGRRPRPRRLRPLEHLQQTSKRSRRHQRSLQPAGSSTTRTWDASR